MKIKKPLLLPLLAAVVLPFVFVLPTFARAPMLPADDSGPVCKPVVQISFRNLNFFLDAIRLEVSPCAIAALQQRARSPSRLIKPSQMAPSPIRRSKPSPLPFNRACSGA